MRLLGQILTGTQRGWQMVSRQTKGKGEEAVNGAALVVDKTHSLDKD